MAYNKLGGETPQNEIRKVRTGVSHAHISPILSDGYGPAIKQLGMRGVSRETEQENVNFYADDVIHITTPGVALTSGELTFYQISEDVETEFLGMEKNLSAIMTDTNQIRPFAMQWVTNEISATGKKYIIQCLYNLNPLSPSLEQVTNEDGLEAEEMKIGYSAAPSPFAVADSGSQATYGYFVCPDGTTENELKYCFENGGILDPLIPPIFKAVTPPSGG